MKYVTFPFQQGELDSLCSVYAIINLLYLTAKRNGKPWIEGRTDKEFLKLIENIAKKKGKLLAAIIKGIEPSDIVKLFACSNVKVNHTNEPDREKVTQMAKSGAVIFFEQLDTNFDHYTVIQAFDGRNDFDLFDSFGFKEIGNENGFWYIDGKRIKIKDIFYI